MIRAFAAAVVPLAAAFAQSATPVFDVASVKPAQSGLKGRKGMTTGPGRLTYTNVSLLDCIQAAYGVRVYQISGPAWLGAERYDIAATAGGPVDAPQLYQMLQSLLAERFQLKLHRATRELPVFGLVVAKNGPKLKEGDGQSAAAMKIGAIPGAVEFQNYSMAALAGQLSERFFGLERPVIDQTALPGKFDFILRLADSNDDLKRSAERGEGTPIFAVLSELGLKLEAQKAPVEILVVDGASKVPTEN